MLGKSVNDLQTDVVVSDDAITGTLHYITDYTGYSDQPEEQTGNYLALKFDSYPEDAEIKLELVGSGRPEKIMKSRDVVIRVTNKDSEKVKFTVSHASVDEPVVKIYSLTGLTLEPGE